MVDVPYLQVVRGEPTAEELAVVIAVVAAAASVGSQPALEKAKGWSDRRHLLRPAVVHGFGAWTASARLR